MQVGFILTVKHIPWKKVRSRNKDSSVMKVHSSDDWGKFSLTLYQYMSTNNRKQSDFPRTGPSQTVAVALNRFFFCVTLLGKITYKTVDYVCYIPVPYLIKSSACMYTAHGLHK